MRFLPCGADAVLVELDDLDHVGAVQRDLREARDRGELPGLLEVVPAARTVLVVAEPGRPGALDAVRTRVGELRSGALRSGELGPGPGDVADDPVADRAPVELATHYDGEDLDLVARDAGTDRAGVVDLHTAATLTVAFGGFAPGFAYLAGLPEALHQPRLETPRTRIPAGAVGVAGGFGGVYPRASPGGWRLLGRLAAAAPVLFDPDRDPPALLTPGTRVRFRDAGPP